MSEMVERVARALAKVDLTGDTDEAGEILHAFMDDYRDMARAAIEAMRVPTEAMAAAGMTCEAGTYEEDIPRNIHRHDRRSTGGSTMTALAPIIKSDDDGCLAAVPTELTALGTAIGKTPANDNGSFFERAMRVPCGAPLPAKRDIKLFLVDEAAKVVTGARREAYGKPEDNFERIAKFWQAYFENTGRGSAKITAQDVSPLMRLMKEARLCESPGHLDSFVDIIGYTMTGAEVNGVE